jgi:TPP-dependent 2-oxoacid decarboxylase
VLVSIRKLLRLEPPLAAGNMSGARRGVSRGRQILLTGDVAIQVTLSQIKTLLCLHVSGYHDT